MKKFSTILAVLLVVLMLAGSALASENVSISANYSNGTLSWNVSNACELYTIYVDGHKLVNYSEASGSYKITLDPAESHTVKVVCLLGHSDSTTIGATVVAPTEAPATEAPATEAPATEAPATEAPATEAPATEAPATEAPATEAPATEAPATEAPATVAPATQAPATQAPATQAPATQAPVVEDDVEDDDVPKTGDNTVVFVTVAMLAAAAYLVSRRFARV